ncbi:hypothetical protein JCM15831A_14520 [Asaia astilbis]
MRWLILIHAAELQWIACILLHTALSLKWASDHLNAIALRLMVYANRKRRQ